MPQFSAFSSQFGTPVNPGAYRYQIIYKRAVKTAGEFNEDVTALVNFQSLKASVKSLVGRELQAAQQIDAEARYKIEHHYVRGIEREMQIEWYVDGSVKLLDVIDPGDPVGDQRTQTVYAKDFER